MVVRWKLFLISLCVASSIFANTPVIGWHWYNESIGQKPLGKGTNDRLLAAFNQLSPLQQLQLLQAVTKNLRAKSVLSGKVADIKAYKQAQDFWVQRATQFAIGWEKMLLLHPELNYALRYSHENRLAPIMQQGEHAREVQAIAQLATTHGLLFFYRGKNKGDALFATIVSHYVKQHHLVLIPVSVDGVLSPVFVHNRQAQGLEKAHALGIDYFPTLVLVDPRTHQHQVVSYGFKSANELSARFLKIADDWQVDF